MRYAKQTFGPDIARKLYRLETGQDKPEQYASVQEWLRQCYSRPSEDELILHAMNEVLEGFGTEAIESPDYQVDRYHYGIVAVYVNRGDTYEPTVLYETETGRFRLTSWGDWVERNERRYRLS